MKIRVLKDDEGWVCDDPAGDIAYPTFTWQEAMNVAFTILSRRKKV